MKTALFLLSLGVLTLLFRVITLTSELSYQTTVLSLFMDSQNYFNQQVTDVIFKHKQEKK